MPDLADLLSRAQLELLAARGARLLLILVLTWAVLAAVRLLTRRLERHLLRGAVVEGEPPSESQKRIETLTRLLRSALAIAVWVLAVLAMLSEVGVDVGPLLAGAGVLGIAVGIGGQNLVRDIIAGFFLILENQVRVGDVAVVNGTGGLVEAINFRTIVLRDLTGTVHVFPNGSVTTLANMTKEWSAYVFDIGVAYREDPDQVIELMREVGEAMREDPTWGRLILDPVEVFGVDNFADSAVVIKGRIKTRPIKQWDVGREYRRRLKHAFAERGIEIPFPQRTLHLAGDLEPLLGAASDRDGTGPVAAQPSRG